MQGFDLHSDTNTVSFLLETLCCILNLYRTLLNGVVVHSCCAEEIHTTCLWSWNLSLLALGNVDKVFCVFLFVCSFLCLGLNLQGSKYSRKKYDPCNLHILNNYSMCVFWCVLQPKCISCLVYICIQLVFITQYNRRTISITPM